MNRMLTVSLMLALVASPAFAQKRTKDPVDPIAADQEIGRTGSTRNPGRPPGWSGSTSPALTHS